MFTTFDQAIAYIQEQKIKMVDFKFTDLWGRLHHITIPSSQFTPSVMTEGIGFDGSAVGLKSVKSGDMVLVPDLSTGFLDPFWNHPTLSFICSTFEADSHEIFPNDPRNIAIKAETYLQKLGIASESKWGPEYEFYIFDEVSWQNEINHTSVHLTSSEAEWNSADGTHGHYIPLHGGYHAAPPKDQLFNLRSEISLLLADAGIPVKYHHHEVGGPGQSEIETHLMGLLQAGDATTIIKYFVKMTARKYNKTATFMPKPLYGEAGSGMHFHQQLLKHNKNLFYSKTGYGHMSKIAMQYIGGLLQHGSSLLGLTNPSTNSYRRLVPGYEAPINAFFSLGNRSAAIRIPIYAAKPDNARFEFRPPDATCNVYLALAAQLMAGLDGIAKQIDPTEAGFGPYDSDIFSWSAEKRKTIKSLPSSLDEACSALISDREYLLAGGVFSTELIENWVNHKLTQEYYPVRNRPHPYEMSLYFDV